MPLKTQFDVPRCATPIAAEVTPEVLVHATAPNAVTDDSHFRQLARAYIEFVPQQRQPLNVESRRAGSKGAPGPKSVEPVSTPLHGDWAESQELSFQGALDNHSSPHLRLTAAKKASVAGNAGEEHHVGLPRQHSVPLAGEQLPSQIEDSYPLPDSQMICASPSRILEMCLIRHGTEPRRHPEHSRHSTRSTSAQCAVDGDPVYVPSSLPIPEQESDRGDATDRSDAAVVIPSSLPSEPGRPLARRPTRPAEQDVPAFDVSHVSSSEPSLPEQEDVPPSAPHHLPPVERQKRSQGASQYRPTGSSLRRSPRDRPVPTPSDSPTLESLDHVLEIRSPSPPVAADTIEPADLVSDMLAKLARDISSRYRPLVRRPTQPFERGYWRLNCSAWPRDARRSLWLFLTNYLKSQLAGWGVWCRRDPPHALVRLFCWAHVAKHMYLLLYIGSGRLLKGTRAEWIDAEGYVVLEVPPVDRLVA